ncbi:hypothetical protein DEI99_008585 [Curtobacterium sp. MCLR17_036]|uniref:hypothetical protein n=1 Tax=Curtobacterium sp. MCLR17_036 TaxID=2175620 RepID=UPI000DA720C5|nr:hypothetical protein [Curtobacterium sp. MCLR17_036]WIE66573.1 hypothetical protein DEI99_008585 [Curtobacterium sp. MCLR17_036]
MLDPAHSDAFPADSWPGALSSSWPDEETPQRAIEEANRKRSVYRRVARIGFVLAPAMFFLPLIVPLVTREWHAWVIICMTAAWAVLVSACSFAAMANTRPGGHPGVHQTWAVPTAVIVMVPGGLAAFFLYGAVIHWLYLLSR